jgi:hypothetical protein
MDSNRGCWTAGFAALALLGCQNDVPADDEAGATTMVDDGSGSSDSTGADAESETAAETESESETESETGELECSCAPGTEQIHVLSDAGALWRFDPLAETFTSLGQVGCGSGSYYSMAVDHDGRGWLLDLDTRDLLVLDLDDPGSCTEPPWVPGNGGFQYFGMGFVSEGGGSLCESLYMLRYSGEGPFAEGPGIGAIGVYDPADGSVESLAAIDYDGGEITGTGDGRVFAFAGVDPAKLIEYDPSTGEPLAILPLDGLDKTTASAFAFHSGDLWFFTEAQPPECGTCLDACSPAHATCLADPDCAESLECLLTTGQPSDECGGLVPMDLQLCVFNQCGDECFPPEGKVSEIHRLDWDHSEGPDPSLTKLEKLAPVRVVGAGVSICAPFELP